MGRNLAHDPRALVHLESGEDVVILTSEAERARDTALLARFVDVYAEKYDYRMDLTNEDTPIYVLKPRCAQTWTEREFPGAAVRWVF